MEKYVQMGLLSLLIVGVFSACERMSGINAYAFSGNDGEAQEFVEASAREEKLVQAALYEDAQLAHKMPLKQFARYMKARHSYYKDYTTKYQDDFVTISVDGDKMWIETRKGKVKMEYSAEESARR